MASTTLVTLVHAAVALALIGAATALLALHDIDGTTAMALYTAALATIGAGTSTALALKVPAPGTIAVAEPLPPPDGQG
jgi:hypothetical protein